MSLMKRHTGLRDLLLRMRTENEERRNWQRHNGYVGRENEQTAESAEDN